MYLDRQNKYKNVKLDVVEDEFLSTENDRTLSYESNQSNFVT